MTQERRSGPPTGRPDTITYPQITAAGRVYASPPCRGRSLWLAVTLRCPWCGTGHAHRVGEAARLLAGRVDKLCPVTGKAYLLSPVRRGREARRG